MSRPGRKSKRPVSLARVATAAALNEINREKARAKMQVVLAQPHRRGCDAKECVSALGRFWLSLKTDNRVLLTAGEEYAGLVRRWRAAWGVMNGEAPREGSGMGLGPSAATVRAWRRQIDAIQIALMAASFDIRTAVERLVIDDCDLVGRDRLNAQIGLRIVAIELGLASVKDHPFR